MKRRRSLYRNGNFPKVKRKCGQDPNDIPTIYYYYIFLMPGHHNTILTLYCILRGYHGCTGFKIFTVTYNNSYAL